MSFNMILFILKWNLVILMKFSNMTTIPTHTQNHDKSFGKQAR